MQQHKIKPTINSPLFDKNAEGQSLAVEARTPKCAYASRGTSIAGFYCTAAECPYYVGGYSTTKFVGGHLIQQRHIHTVRPVHRLIIRTSSTRPRSIGYLEGLCRKWYLENDILAITQDGV